MGAGIVGILFIIAFFWALAVFLLPFFVWGISEKMDKQQKTLRGYFSIS